MDEGSRRLKQTQSNLLNDAPLQWHRTVVLPDDLPAAVASLPDGSKKIAIGENNVLDYRPLTREVALVLSAVGTPYEQDNPTPKYTVLEFSSPTNSPVSFADLWGAIYALWTLLHTQEQIPFVFDTASLPNGDELAEELLLSGLARSALDPKVPELFLQRGAFWQGAGTGPLWKNSRGWLRSAYAARTACFPSTPSFTRTPTVIAAHPLRPPNPRGGTVLYRRYCPSVVKTLTIIALNPENGAHMAKFHQWHNHELVNKGWGEHGTMEQHVKYVQGVVKDPDVLPVLMSWDDELMGYCEITWVKENHLGTHIYDGAHDYDRGLHCLVGEDKYRGSAFSQAWFRSFLHFVFISDPRTLRLIGEPNRKNRAMIKLSCDAGMHLDASFYFPHKASYLSIIHREQIFREDYFR